MTNAQLSYPQLVEAIGQEAADRLLSTASNEDFSWIAQYDNTWQHGTARDPRYRLAGALAYRAGEPESANPYTLTPEDFGPDYIYDDAKDDENKRHEGWQGGWKLAESRDYEYGIRWLEPHEHVISNVVNIAGPTEAGEIWWGENTSETFACYTPDHRSSGSSWPVWAEKVKRRRVVLYGEIEMDGAHPEHTDPDREMRVLVHSFVPIEDADDA